ncbi:MAG: GNAT family N-acetyltransferase [Spirochaetales bacterium]|nr:GNAT family N-acetyltransferase [Spirochaetales bacterium]
MEIVKAGKEDLKEILELQKLCYRQEATIYNDYTIPPLLQTYADMVEECGRKLVLKAVENKRIAGSVRANATIGTCYIGRLIVHPDFQNKGIGAALMQRIESEFRAVDRYELFTGYKSEKNLYLYKKLGYTVYKQEKVSDAVRIVYLEKQNKGRKNKLCHDKGSRE